MSPTIPPEPLAGTLPLTRDSIEAAHKIIRPYIHETPVMTSQTLNRIASTPQDPSALVGTPFEGREPARPKINLFFKCENYQKIGAFKARGAFHAIGRLSDEEVKRGVCTQSSGNHAAAVAFAAKTRGISAHIVMPSISTPSKIAATASHGAHIYYSGSMSEEREARAEEVIRETGARLIPPYDYPDIILGQGTTGLELERQIREMVRERPRLSVKGEEGVGVEHDHHLDALISPLGGGGLLSGLATCFADAPTKVFAAEPSFQGANDGQRGLASDPPTRIPSVRSLTIADGLRTPVGKIPWTVISDRKKVAGVYSVSEEQIKSAMRLVMERMKVFVEPSAVVGLAVVLFDEAFRTLVEREGGVKGWDVGVVFSGGNTTIEGIAKLFGPDVLEQVLS